MSTMSDYAIYLPEQARAYRYAFRINAGHIGLESSLFKLRDCLKCQLSTNPFNFNWDPRSRVCNDCFCDKLQARLEEINLCVLSEINTTGSIIKPCAIWECDRNHRWSPLKECYDLYVLSDVPLSNQQFPGLAIDFAESNIHTCAWS